MSFLKSLGESLQAGVDKAFGAVRKKGGDVQAETRAKIHNILSQLGIDRKLDPKGLMASLLAKATDDRTSAHELAQIQYVLDLIQKL